jgi:coatomer subunit beta'
MKSIKIETSKRFKHFGEKIKQVSFHPSKPLILLAQYDGEVAIYNYNTQTLTKKFEVSSQPIRSAIWAGEDWIVTAGDDLQIRIFNFHTTQKLHQFEGHKDFLRKVIFNEGGQYIMSCSDDKTIIRWSNIGGKFQKNGSWEEHKHFVMDVKFHPKDEGVFASASLDGTIKLWNVASTTSNGTLKGHKSGINCLEFSKGDRSLLASGGDDYTVIVWDISSRSILQKIEKHEGNVIDIKFLDSLPFFVSVAEDGKLNFYNIRNFEFCFDVVNFMNKGWSLSAKDNLIAAGFDEGAVVLQVGNNLPLASCGKGRLIWSRNSEVFSANLKALVSKKLANFEKIDVDSKEIGNLEIFPNKITHNDNAQFFSVTDDSEYIIYKSQSFKQILFGKAQELVWGPNNKFAILDMNKELTIYSTNGNQIKSLKFDFRVNNIYSGTYLGVAAEDFVIFYDWNGENCIGRIDVETQALYWDNLLLVVKSEKSFFQLKVNPDLDEENVFELLSEVNDRILSGLWIGNIFAYVSETFKLNLVVKGKVFTASNINHFTMALEYIENHERIFFFDNNCSITSFRISKDLIKILSNLQNSEEETIPREIITSTISNGIQIEEGERDFLSKVVVALNEFEAAFAIVANIRQKLELGIKIGFLDECVDLCSKMEEPIYWKKLGDLAMLKGQFEIAEKAFWSCEDLNSLLLLGSSLGSVDILERVSEFAKEKKHYSVGFMSNWVMGRAGKCLDILIDSERFGEAAIFAKTYQPSKIIEVYEAWRANLKKKNNHLLLKRLENPLSFPNEYPELTFLAEIEKIVEEVTSVRILSSEKYAKFHALIDDLDFYQTAKDQGLDELKERLTEIYSKCATVDHDELHTRQNESAEQVGDYEAEFDGEGWEEVDMPVE